MSDARSKDRASLIFYLNAFSFDIMEEHIMQELICRNEEKLSDTMTDEQKERFEKYSDCVREYQTITDCLIFQNSFKLGARMMLEGMED